MGSLKRWAQQSPSSNKPTLLLCFSLIQHSADEAELRCGFFSPHCEDGAWLCLHCHMLRFEAAVTVLSSPPHQATVTNAISPQETICPWKHSQTGVAYAPSIITWSFLFSASNKASTRSSKNHTWLHGHLRTFQQKKGLNGAPAGLLLLRTRGCQPPSTPLHPHPTLHRLSRHWPTRFNRDGWIIRANKKRTEHPRLGMD